MFEDCDYFTEPDIVLVVNYFEEFKGGPPCNVEDNLRVGHIVIEDWFGGY